MNMTSFSRILARYSLLLVALFGLAAPAIASARRSPAREGPAPLVFAGEIHGRARIGVGSLNLRTGPHVSYTAVAYLMEGEEVAMVGRNRASTWVQIRLYNGYRGWINTSYIDTNVAIDALPVIDVSLLGITAFVTNDPVPVYTGPGASYPHVDRARPGDVLALNGRDAAAGWVHVYLPDGRTGWAAAGSSFLPSGSINDLPIITPFLDAQPPNLAPFFLAYSGPGFLYDPVDSVKAGQMLTIIARTSDNRWIQVRLPDGREGWLAAEIVHIDAALAGIPVVAGIAPPEVVGWMPSRPAQTPPGKIPLQPTEPPGPSATATATATTGGLKTPAQPQATATAGPTETAPPSATQTATSSATQTPTPTATTAGTSTATSTTPATRAATAEATAEPTGEAATTPPASVPVVYVYATPDESSAPFVRLVPGQSVVLLGRTADAAWLKIWLPGDREGWVRADALQLTIDVTELPVLEP